MLEVLCHKVALIIFFKFTTIHQHINLTLESVQKLRLVVSNTSMFGIVDIAEIRYGMMWSTCVKKKLYKDFIEVEDYRAIYAE